MKIIPPYSMLLRISWRHYIQRFDVILLANLIVALPINLVIDLTLPRYLQTVELATVEDIVNLVTNPDYILNTSLQFFANLLTVFVVIAMTLSIKQMYQKKIKFASQTIKQALSYLPVAFLASFIINALTLIGIAALIIPGIIVALFLNFTVPAMVWHKLPLMKAFKYSIQTVKKNWWAVFSYLVLVNLLVSIVALVVMTIIPDSTGFTTAGLTISSIATSFTAVFSVVLFAALDLHLKQPQPKKND